MAAPYTAIDLNGVMGRRRTITAKTPSIEVVVPSVPGAEWTAEGDRLHWRTSKERLHWTDTSNRLHWKTGEE